MERADRKEEARREAVSSVASDLRRQAERSGVPLSQSDAEARVRRAVVAGDMKRENSNR